MVTTMMVLMAVIVMVALAKMMMDRLSISIQADKAKERRR